MSTTFGIKLPDNYKNYGNSYPLDDIEDGILEIAFRSFTINFINPLAIMLPDDTPVIPTDNSAQGIYTIGDIKRKIEEQNE